MRKLLLAMPILVLMASLVVAGSLITFSLRGVGGDVVQVNGDTGFVASKVKFSAHNQRGSLIIQGETSSGEKARLGVKIRNSDVVLENSNVIKVVSDGYYYAREKDWRNFVVIKKVEGTVTYTYNKNTEQTDIRGTNGLNFRVDDIPTRRLK